MLHSTLQELNNFYPVLTCTQFMATQIHNFQTLSHLFYFSFQSLCGALGDASQSTLCSVEHSLGMSALHVSGVKHPSSGGTTLAVFDVSCVHLQLLADCKLWE